jgi:NAD(P)H-flavin reductase/ferredoxin
VLSTIHAAGRALFMRADAAFNRVFGEALNPLYHLGQLGYLLFWVVLASGFYVYAFYETGLDTTYASVERLTHAQWWAGGIMRSLHRYASAALVVTMLLHLARHFAFDRYRGFRAFSWLSGIVVLALIHASGINGYMLPWDRLAQVTVITVSEWFDTLPVFRGTMVRNFILPGALSDRFFSLLQFPHIGLPLAALAALWVHTQRVPRARTLPPRALAIGMLLMLLGLSLLRPAVSQGAADFSRQPAAVAIDWFYLALLPPVAQGHGLLLWWLLAAAAGLMLLLPWLPPLRASAARAWTMRLHGEGSSTVAVRAGETLLDAALRAQLAVPFDCRAGGCGLCRATVLNGEVDAGAYQSSALDAAARTRGEVLLCCAQARSDLEVELPLAAPLQRPSQHEVTVERMQLLAPDVMLLALRLPAGQQIAFDAGQYLNVILEDGARRSYSFTAPSGRIALIELHIRRVDGGRFSTQVFERMRTGDALRIEGPLGRFVLHEPSSRPLVFVAGATGFAPVKSLLEQAFRLGITRPLHLYWGVRRRRDLYLAALPEQWAREHPNFRYVPVLSEPAPEDAWTGRSGLVHEAILADFPDLSGVAIYACGSVQMVETARPAFIRQGLGEQFCFSDALAPPPQRAGPERSP